VTVTGTAADTGGVVAGVEVSTDGGTTWHAATGTTSWSYSWVAHGNPTAAIKSRAVDDSGNVQNPSAGVTVNIGCSCSIWGNGATPGTADSGSGAAVEVGVKFKSDVSGSVTGVRFYKASTNTGTHVGNLWSASGTKLASVTFTGESGSGWQQATFVSPVSINANTTYVVSYFAPSGHTAQDEDYFYPPPSPNPYTSGIVDSPPLHALRNSNGSLNGLFQNSSTSTFPSNSTNARNYWVDAMFSPRTGAATAPAAPTGVTASPGKASALVSWTTPPDGGSAITGYTVTPFIGTTAQTPTTVTGSPPATTATVSGLTNGTTYTFTVAAKNAVGTGPASAASNAVIPSATACTACTIWPATATPTSPSDSDTSSIEVGVKFTSDTNGSIAGVRFYKGSGNTGTHVGNLWTSTGTKLASATFTGESASGWQQVNFATPVPITAGTVYVASYLAPSGHYAADSGFFSAAGVDNAPLHALADGVSGGNGVYAYGASSTFPSNSFGAANYWVDVVYATGAATAPGAPTGVTATGGNASATVSWTAPSNGGSTITGYTVTPFIGTTAQPPTTVTGNPPATTATVNGLTNGTAYTFKVTATNAIATGPSSASSNSVTPAAATAPGTPTGVTAGAGNASATVSWTAPSNGGSAITSYTVTPFIGTTAQPPTTVTGSPPATTATVSGLTNGTTYTFKVAATNAAGTGPASAASNAVTPSATACTACTIWPDTATPTTPSDSDTSAVTLGVKFKSDVNGTVTGIRFYKGSGNTGTHVGNLWSSTGTKLATATFANETASGWQQVNFTTPVSITAGTVYVASYLAPVGRYAGDGGYFATAGVDNAPLHALKDGVSGGNGVYAYGSAATFPSNTFNSANYWVDVVFSSGAPTAPAAPTGVTATGGNASATVSWTAPSNGGSGITGYTVTPFIGTTAQTPTTVTGNPPATTASVTGLTNGTAYTFKVTATNAVGTGPASASSNSVTPAAPTVPGAPTGVTAGAGNAQATVSWTAPSNGGSAITGYTVTPFIGTTAQTPTTVTGSPPATTASVTGLTNGTAYTFTVAATNAVGTGPASAASAAVTPSGTSCTGCTIWPATATPTTPSDSDTSSLEIGVKFKADVNGKITGIRFYKGTGNTGTHVANLWTSTGTKLATATFANETASGWQQVNFATPVSITAGTVYVASYFAPVGRYAGDGGYFATTGVDNGPLHALKDGVSGGNGVYAYGSTSAFPSNTFNSANYWVDVVFATS